MLVESSCILRMEVRLLLIVSLAWMVCTALFGSGCWEQTTRC